MGTPLTVVIDPSIYQLRVKWCLQNRTDADADKRVNNCCVASCQILNQYITLQVQHISPMDCTYCHFISCVFPLSIAVAGTKLFPVPCWPLRPGATTQSH